MSQPFSQSKEYRDLTLNEIYGLTEDEARDWFARLRWGSTTHVPCTNPNCMIVDKHYVRKNRNQWRCRHCHREFSVTSGTPFADHKISFKQLIAIIYEFVSDPKGSAANKNCARHGIAVRTFYQNAMKLRECLLKSQDHSLLKGLVQIDVGFFCGKPRRTNKRDKVTSELINAKLRNRKAAIIPNSSISHVGPANKEKLKNRRMVIAMKQILGPLNQGNGADRTITVIVKKLDSREMLSFVKKFVDPTATIWTDFGGEFSKLSLWAKHEAVNHSVEYMNPKGVNNNQAEAFMSRLRRAEYGTYHGMRPQYFAQYAAETAWREDTRKISLRTKLEEILKRAMSHGLSRYWRGYCKGYRLQVETLGIK